MTAAEPETSQTTDYELGQKAAQGDMAAFEQLYQRHNRRVYSLCLRMTGNVSEAEDLAQEVFIQLFRKIGSFRGESAFTTWLHRLTVNQVLMHFRKRGVRMEQTTEDGETPIQIVKGTENPNAMPEDAAPYVAVMATGRSDYSNQINNVLCFPGIFRGALACRARRINEEMKLAAANAIAGIITEAELHPEYIVPSVFDKRVAEAVAREVEAAAYQTGVARRESGLEMDT